MKQPPEQLQARRDFARGLVLGTYHRFKHLGRIMEACGKDDRADTRAKTLADLWLAVECMGKVIEEELKP
jgi:hypothetical protein